MEPSDMVIAAATLLGPILAVQAQKWIERARSRRDRKDNLFQALMAHRAYRVSMEFVRALNMIDVTYCGVRVFSKQYRSTTEQAVIDTWRVYHDHLHGLADTVTPEVVRQWEEKCVEVMTDMLEAMATDLGYHFDRVLLKKGSYAPRAHGQYQMEMQAMRQLFIQAASGALQAIQRPQTPAGAPVPSEGSERPRV